MTTRRRAAVCTLVSLALGCARAYEGGGELRARKRVLEREVDGLRAAVGRIERHEPLLPTGDLVVAIDDTLLRGVIAAQLPFEAKVKDFDLTLDEADLAFRGAPTVRMHGRLKRSRGLGLEAVVSVLGALDGIAVDPGRGALVAKIAVDHIGIEKVAGVESVLSGQALDELARTVRLQIADKLPPIQIPVKVQQSIEFPAITTGPVRLDGARMPLAASVSGVFAGQGRLWVAIHLQPGELVKTKDAPEAADSSPDDVDAGFDTPATAATPKAKTAKGAKP